jgi:hypothetical protein
MFKNILEKMKRSSPRRSNISLVLITIAGVIGIIVFWGYLGSLVCIT